MQNKTSGAGTIIFGLFLIGLGILFLVGQFVRFDIWHYLWPFFIVGFGLLFFVGMFTGGKEAGALAVPGTIITMLGLLMLFQNTFNHWASWAYAWALLAPTGVGIGLMIFARWSDKPNLYQPGWILTILGLLIFVVLGGFFELLIGLAGFSTAGRILWPLLLIAIGALLLLGRGFGWFFSSLMTPPGAVRTPETRAPNSAPLKELPSSNPTGGQR